MTPNTGALGIVVVRYLSGDAGFASSAELSPSEIYYLLEVPVVPCKEQLHGSGAWVLGSSTSGYKEDMKTVPQTEKECTYKEFPGYL